MSRNLRPIIASIGLVAMTSIASAEVYLQQLNGTPRPESAFVNQMPADAKPVAPQPQKKRVARKPSPQPVALLPNVGAGVSVAIAGSVDTLPSVGSGVIRR